MQKNRSSHALIFLLLILLGAWWLLTSVRLAAPPSSVAGPVVVLHSFKNGTDSYSGTLMLSGCDDLQTGISGSSSAPTHVKLSFTAIRRSDSCQSTAPTPTPFLMSYSSTPTHGAVLDSVLINNQAATFSVMEQVQ